MRHGVKRATKLGRNNDQRRKLLRSLASSVIIHEKIETTQARAKAIRSVVDKLITKGKIGTLHAKRQLFADLTQGAARKTFEVLADRYKERKGGYTRILISGKAKDGMNKYLVELV